MLCKKASLHKNYKFQTLLQCTVEIYCCPQFIIIRYITEQMIIYCLSHSCHLITVVNVSILYISVYPSWQND